MSIVKDLPFRFLELPLELQDRVVTFATTSYTAMITCIGETINISSRCPLNILLTCRYFNTNFKTATAKRSPAGLIFAESLEEDLSTQTKILQNYLHYFQPGSFLDRYKDKIRCIDTSFLLASVVVWAEIFPNLLNLRLKDQHITSQTSNQPYYWLGQIEDGKFRLDQTEAISAQSPPEDLREHMLGFYRTERCWKDKTLLFDCSHHICCYDPFIFSLTETMTAYCTASHLIRQIWTAWGRWWAWRTFFFNELRRDDSLWTRGHQVENVTISESWLVQLNLPESLWSKEREQLGVDEDLLVVNFEHAIISGRVHSTLTSMDLRKAKGLHKKCRPCKRIIAAG